MTANQFPKIRRYISRRRIGRAQVVHALVHHKDTRTWHTLCSALGGYEIPGPGAMVSLYEIPQPDVTCPGCLRFMEPEPA